MPFIDGIWVEAPSPQIQDKIKFYANHITLSFIRSSEYNGEYRLSFLVIANIPGIDFTNFYNLRRIDRVSLGEAIFGSLNEYDKEFIVLEDFGLNKCIFRFDWKKWFRSALKNVNPQTTLSKFEKSFHFNKQLPRMMQYNFDPYMGQFLVKKFKEYATEMKMKSWFDSFIPKEIRDQTKTKMQNMFDYSYDYQTNRIVLRLKNSVVFALLFSVNQISTAYNKQQPYVKIDFNKKVSDHMKEFDRSKWETFIKKKFI